ncbi:MAG: DUF58 domain-containing protein [Acidobacteria bacterium]|nr:DUF58 domain-containing protein [Acidobacteriota bacterium]
MNVKSSYRLFPLSFAITRSGILHLLMIILLSLAAVNSSNNLLFVILATMISAFVVSSIVGRNSLKHISMSIQVPERVFEGDRVPVKVSVRNTKRIFPSFSICIEDSRKKAAPIRFPLLGKLAGKKPGSGRNADAAVFDGLHPFAYFPVLRPGETHSELTVQSFPRRGLFRLEEFRISTRFPFSLFRHNERIGVGGEVLVYPFIRNISTYFQRLPFLPGLLEGMQKGLGENLFSIRPYAEGESTRTIDWKATAKTRELMAREFAREEECKFCLILDTKTDRQAEGGYWEEFEKAVSLTASIAAHFIDRGAEIELLTPHSHIPRGTGRDHLYRILRFLATVEYSRSVPESKMDMSPWYIQSFPGIQDSRALKQIFSDKVFKIILASDERDAFPPSVRRSSHRIHFSEL